MKAPSPGALGGVNSQSWPSAVIARGSVHDVGRFSPVHGTRSTFGGDALADGALVATSGAGLGVTVDRAGSLEHAETANAASAAIPTGFTATKSKTEAESDASSQPAYAVNAWHRSPTGIAPGSTAANCDECGSAPRR